MVTEYGRLDDAIRSARCRNCTRAGFSKNANTGCFTADLPLIAASLEDVLIEPQRKGLIPGFQAVKNAAITALTA